MSIVQQLIKTVILLLLAFACVVHVRSQSLDYQSRGGRFEGIKPMPVSGQEIELVSALANFTEQAETLPDTLKIRFYLTEDTDVHLMVREVDYRHYYWMDRVTPLRPWQAGFENLFEWSSENVLKHLAGLGMYDLGVVARLSESPIPSQRERIAPVIFYHSEPPERVAGYLFIFRSNIFAQLTASVYEEEGTEPLFQQSFSHLVAGRLFSIRWDSPSHPDGFYKLVLSGQHRYKEGSISQTVSFYHRADVMEN